LPFVAEVAAIVGPAAAVLVTMLILRFTHFENAIEMLQEKVNTGLKDTDSLIGNEIKKGENADIRGIKDMVKRSSSLETTISRLERLEKRLIAFYWDFISLGFLSGIAAIAILVPQFDPLSILVMTSLGFIVFLNIYNFITNVQDFQEIKRKFRKGETG
jgi:hypothetical protein